MISSEDRNRLQSLSVRDLFADDAYRVPLYQRAYAWTEVEINTLLRDIRDARLNSQGRRPDGERRDYYIGSLVVNTVRSHEGVVYEVVDGQQRLTTLFIVLAIAPGIVSSGSSAGIGPLKDKLVFEGRSGAGDDLMRLARDGGNAINRLSTDGIRFAAEVVENAAVRGESVSGFSTVAHTDPPFSDEDLGYLLDNVKILRSELPPGTDLNHYFEVMNTRGEQLEKHEILKSRLISALDDVEERNMFSQIWDACSVLDRHIQTQFSTVVGRESHKSARDRIFGDSWDRLIPEHGRELFDALCEMHDRAGPAEHRERIGLADVLKHGGDRSVRTSLDAEESETSVYGPIIDFPNLLLHVLKVQLGDCFSWSHVQDDIVDRVKLEDKYLLAEFGQVKRDSEWVREFAFLLLKTRYLMDTYVIRTQKTMAGDDAENWVIQQAFKYSRRETKRQLSARSTFSPDGRQESDGAAQRGVLMLQAMFQVTDTSRASKHFLFQIIAWLHSREDPSAVDRDEFVRHMESMARDRLRTMRSAEYLHSGTHVPNFIFNVLDYELWRIGATVGTDAANSPLGIEAANALQKSAKHFRFRYRTSVEHFYPVMPTAEQGHLQLPDELSNNFGNLCIMSRSENSRRNNLMPKAKAEEFASTGQSLKFQLMSALALRAPAWSDQQIRDHGDEMMRVLDQFLKGNNRQC